MPLNGQLSPLMADGDDRVLIGGIFYPNGSSAVSNTSNKPLNRASLWTVARTSAGLFTITLATPFARFFPAWATLGLTTGDDKFAQWTGATELTTADSLLIRVWDISGAAVDDVAADAGNWISWGGFVVNTGVSRP